MTPRDTDRLESVIAEAIRAVGIEQACNATGLGKTTLYDYADENDHMLPRYNVLLALDAAVVSQTGRSPMLSWWTRQLARRTNGSEPRSTCLLSALLTAGEALGALQGAAKAAVCPDGPGGQAVTPRERRALQALLRACQEELDGIAECLSDRKEPLDLSQYRGAKKAIRVEGKIS